MAQNVIINGATYPNVPEVDIPQAGGGTARFVDTSDANAVSGDLLAPKTMYVGGNKVTGGIPTKAAATYTPTGADQTIAAQQYLGGAQTIEAVVVTGLSPAVLASGVTVKVGTATDDDSVTSVVGALSAAVISQDSTTKVLSIS
jgi:hypothetical protein